MRPLFLNPRVPLRSRLLRLAANAALLALFASIGWMAGQGF